MTLSSISVTRPWVNIYIRTIKIENRLMQLILVISITSHDPSVPILTLIPSQTNKLTGWQKFCLSSTIFVGLAITQACVWQTLFACDKQKCFETSQTKFKKFAKQCLKALALSTIKFLGSYRKIDIDIHIGRSSDQFWWNALSPQLSPTDFCQLIVVHIYAGLSLLCQSYECDDQCQSRWFHYENKNKITANQT